MAKVFISSTSSDLVEYRQVARDTCLDLNLQPVDMEHFPAMGRDPVEGSKQELAGCNVYVGIYAYRYGHIAEGYELSVTELEFDYAGELGIERICFLVDPAHPWPETGRDYDNYKKLQAFKKKVEKSAIRKNFTTLDDFNAKLTKSLVKWRQREPVVLVKHNQPIPFQNYLLQLQQEIADYLERFVLEPIEIPAKPISNKQIKPQSNLSPTLLPTFFSTSLPVKKQSTKKSKTPRYFEHFSEAFEFFNGRVIVLGESGAGKTTTLMTHALASAQARLDDPTRPLTIVARIADWPSEKNLSLIEWLGVQSGLNQDEISLLQKKGLLLLLLDGLDELAARKSHPNALNNFLEAFNSGLFDNKAVITCRSTDYEKLPQQPALDGVVSLLPLHDKRIKNYLKNYPHIWNLLKSDADLLNAVRTPLLLSTLTFTIGHDENHSQIRRLRSLSELPGKIRNAIIQQYVKRRFEHEARKDNQQLSNLERLYEVLGNVAQSLPVEIDTFEPELITNSYGGKQVLETALNLNLIIKETENNLRFAHQIFERHFASTYYKNQFLRNPNWIEELTNKEIDDDVIAALTDVDLIEKLILGLRNPDANELNGNLNDFIHFLKLVQDQVPNSEEGMSDILDFQLNVNKMAVELFTNCLDNSDPEVRYDAIFGLWTTGGEIGSVEPIIDSLTDESEEVRALAAEVLGDLMIKQAIGPITAILHDTSEKVREAATWALSKLR